jgi:hypothetical protein
MRKTTSLLLALAFGLLAPLTGHAVERLAVGTTFAQIFDRFAFVDGRVDLLASNERNSTRLIGRLRLGARNGVLVPAGDIARPAAGCTDKRVP